VRTSNTALAHSDASALVPSSTVIALLQATLERWVQVGTLDVIAAVEAATDDPREQARVLFQRVIASHAEHPGQLRLLTASDHPEIRQAVERATRTRISFVAGLLEGSGQPGPVARRRATLAYATYLGHAQLSLSVPDVLPATPAGRRALLDELTRILFAP
jgi:hypothetical protein